MENLYRQHKILINRVSTEFNRSLMELLPWNSRLMGIKGFRGTGKTTMMLQYIKQHYGFSEDALYVSLDDIYFAANRLSGFVDNFVAYGGKHLFLDEVHKYTGWALDLKNIYDRYPHIKITFTASSLLDIVNAQADLSRRALVFDLQGLSFREYLNFVLGTSFNKLALADILKMHETVSFDISQKVKPLKYFEDYLKSGYYPFFKEDPDFYHKRIQAVLNMIIEIELPLLKKVSIAKLNKIKQLLYIIAQSTPFKPNISKLAHKIGISRNTLLEYLTFLDESKIIERLYTATHGISKLQKPEKIYLENSNLAYALAFENTDIGNIRETFFLNQLKYVHKVTYPPKGDFKVDEKYIFEIGGKNKSGKQIAALDNAFVVADKIETGFKNKIPLWLFGFLY